MRRRGSSPVEARRSNLLEVRLLHALTLTRQFYTAMLLKLRKSYERD